MTTRLFLGSPPPPPTTFCLLLRGGQKLEGCAHSYHWKKGSQADPNIYMTYTYSMTRDLMIISHYLDWMPYSSVSCIIHCSSIFPLNRSISFHFPFHNANAGYNVPLAGHGGGFHVRSSLRVLNILKQQAWHCSDPYGRTK